MNCEPLYEHSKKCELQWSKTTFMVDMELHSAAPNVMRVVVHSRIWWQDQQIIATIGVDQVP